MPILIGILFLSTILAPLLPQEVQNTELIEEEGNKIEVISRSEAQVQEPENKNEIQIEEKTQPAPKPAPPEVRPPGVTARAVLVADATTGEPLLAYQKDKVWPIASLTKLMTAIVYLEQNPDFNKVITLSRQDQVEGSALRVPSGTRFRASDLLRASLMGSANNATNALARAGTNLSKTQFIERMNQEAKELNLHNTHFVEPTGLSPRNRSTPAEYAVIVKEALKNPIIKNIMTSTYHYVRPLNYYGFSIGNTNKLLQQNNGFRILGGKTGFTYGSGYNFAVEVRQGDKGVVVVVFGERNFNKSIDVAKNLARNVLAYISTHRS